MLAVVLAPVAVKATPAACPSVASSALTTTDGFDSPYFPHTGSNNGEGIDFAGGWDAKATQLQSEADMGLHWTWFNVHWSGIEPTQPTAAPPAPVAPSVTPATKWAQLDRFVRKAHDLGLNIALQIVVGGNAGGPPAWAGTRISGNSAPLFMDGTESGANGEGLVPFSKKLAERFGPGGTLAQADGWTDGYGVRAWIMDNEPDSYETNWKGEADDYAEFVVKGAAAIKSVVPGAKIVATEHSEGDAGMPWTTHVLQAGTQEASPTYIANGIDYVAGPSVDVASFHSYELLGGIFGNAFLDGDDLSAQQLLKQARKTKAKWQQFETQAGYTYAPKTELWHTEGGFGFVADDPQGKQNWVVQWLTQAFAFGVTKATIMDATPEEARAVRTMTCLLPNPFPVVNVTTAVGANPSDAFVFRSTRNTDGGSTFVAWARSGGGNVISGHVTVPVTGSNVKIVSRDGVVSAASVTTNPVTGAKTATVDLPTGGGPFNPPVFVVDQ
jgi:hypothetical protein